MIFAATEVSMTTALKLECWRDGAFEDEFQLTLEKAQVDDGADQNGWMTHVG